MPMQTGAVENRRSTPPKGATSTEPATLTKCTETRPASAAISAHSPTRPTWPELRSPIADKSMRAAFLDAERDRLRRDGLAEAELTVENRDHRRIDHALHDHDRRISSPSRRHCT